MSLLHLCVFNPGLPRTKTFPNLSELLGPLHPIDISESLESTRLGSYCHWYILYYGFFKSSTFFVDGIFWFPKLLASAHSNSNHNSSKQRHGKMR